MFNKDLPIATVYDLIMVKQKTFKGILEELNEPTDVDMSIGIKGVLNGVELMVYDNENEAFQLGEYCHSFFFQHNRMPNILKVNEKEDASYYEMYGVEQMSKRFEKEKQS